MATPLINARSLLLLALPPLLWAGNAVVGRALIDSAPPVLLNALRWSLVALLLLPFTRQLWRQPQALVRHWRWWLATGVLGMSAYNTLQYQALHSATAVNVTLIAASLPLAMLLVGQVGFSVRATRRQVGGALLALLGVVVVISHGSLAQLLHLQFAKGDLLMLVATLSWAGYSWMLTRRPAALTNWSWIDLLAVQTLFGLLLAWPMAAAEQSWTSVPLRADAFLGLALGYIVLGPSLLAYRCWALGVAEGGPALAGIFVNLTPLFAALMSALWLAEAPQGFHVLAFALIAMGIAVSAKT
ncbi:MAG: DMT family transporter [Inhella sp.]|jgi:drug/metabolite transporter (DMT)-like permease